jgi:hypothetical protein
MTTAPAHSSLNSAETPTPSKRHWHSLALASACLIAIWAEPQGAQACLHPAPEPDFTWGEPADNATDVPTDVIPHYRMPFFADGIEGDVPGTFTLRTTSSVEVAIVARRAQEYVYELVPAERLDPSTTYVLTGRWTMNGMAIEKTIQFTTGAGPLEGSPAKPDATIEHYEVVGTSGTSCDPSATGSCVPLGDPELTVEFRHIDQFGQMGEPYLARGSVSLDLSGIGQDTGYRCVSLRSRAMNGTYSEPQVLCGDDGPVTQLGAFDVECTSTGLEGTPSDTGCSVGSSLRSRSHAHGAWILGLMLAWLLIRGSSRARA